MSDRVPASRVRAPNFTTEEQELLTDVLKPYLHIIECKKPGAIKLSQKSEAWVKVWFAYNANTRNEPRTKKSLISCYRNMKSKLKKQHFETEMDSRGKIDKASEVSCNNTFQAPEKAKSELVILRTKLMALQIKHNRFLKESELIKMQHKIQELDLKRKVQELELEFAIKQNKLNEVIMREKLELLNLENKIKLSNLL